LTQEPAIFDGTIKENLTYGLEEGLDYDEKKLWEALQMAQIDPLVKTQKD
jgi:ABC-type multidrug transport system fused ATPase/permease subunit